jgi:acyl carrier protein
LDTVEIIMRIEEEFSIDLPDGELGSIRTVGDLYEIVLSKLNTSPSCLSSKSFYQTRRSLVDSLGLPRRTIHPATSLELLLPVESRRRQWNEVAENLGLKFPMLQPSRTQKGQFLALSIVLPTILILSLWGFCHFYLAIAVGGLSLFVAFIAWIFLVGIANSSIAAVMRNRVLELPAATAGDLARMVLTLNFDVFAPASEGNESLTKENVWVRIVAIFSDQMQIDAEEIIPEAKIAEDLRID